jgi:anti-sigma factor RsiW
MDCGNARGVIQDRLDGRLAPRESAELLEHLESCGGCAAEEESLRRVGDLLRLWAAVRSREREPQLGVMWTRVKAGIEERRDPWYVTARRWFWIPAALALAAAALLFYPSERATAPFHPRSFEVSVETLESDATVALVDNGEDLPRVIWILEDAKS